MAVEYLVPLGTRNYPKFAEP